MNILSLHTDDHAIEQRLAARLASSLSAHAQALAPDVSERLRFARELALGRARDVRRLAPAVATAGTQIVGRSVGGAAVLASFVPWWQRAASVLPLVMLLAGLLAIDHLSSREQVLAAAEFDAQLLSDDLPPAAYSDPGFAEYLRASP